MYGHWPAVYQSIPTLCCVVCLSSSTLSFFLLPSMTTMSSSPAPSFPSPTAASSVLDEDQGGLEQLFSRPEVRKMPEMKRYLERYNLVRAKRRRLNEDMDKLEEYESEIEFEAKEIFNGSKPWLIRFEESLSGNSCASQDQLGIGQAMLRELFSLHPPILRSTTSSVALSRLEKRCALKGSLNRRSNLHNLKVAMEMRNAMLNTPMERAPEFAQRAEKVMCRLVTFLGGLADETWSDLGQDESTVLYEAICCVKGMPKLIKNVLKTLLLKQK